MLPSDLDYGAPRVKAFDRNRATEAQQDIVDLLEEARETTVIRSARYQQTHKYYCGRSNDIAWKPKKKPDATTRTRSAPLLRLQQNAIDISRASYL